MNAETREADFGLVRQFLASMRASGIANVSVPEDALKRLAALPAHSAKLEELRRLSEAATGGVWEPGKWEESPMAEFPDCWIRGVGLSGRARLIADTATEFGADDAQANAAFIVAAVSYVRDLLAQAGKGGEDRG